MVIRTLNINVEEKYYYLPLKRICFDHSDSLKSSLINLSVLVMVDLGELLIVFIEQWVFYLVCTRVPLLRKENKKIHEILHLELWIGVSMVFLALSTKARFLGQIPLSNLWRNQGGYFMLVVFSFHFVVFYFLFAFLVNKCHCLVQGWSLYIMIFLNWHIIIFFKWHVFFERKVYT